MRPISTAAWPIFGMSMTSGACAVAATGASGCAGSAVAGFVHLPKASSASLKPASGVMSPLITSSALSGRHQLAWKPAASSRFSAAMDFGDGVLP